MSYPYLDPLRTVDTEYYKKLVELLHFKSIYAKDFLLNTTFISPNNYDVNERFKFFMQFENSEDFSLSNGLSLFKDEEVVSRLIQLKLTQCSKTIISLAAIELELIRLRAIGFDFLNFRTLYCIYSHISTKTVMALMDDVLTDDDTSTYDGAQSNFIHKQFHKILRKCNTNNGFSKSSEFDKYVIEEFSTISDTIPLKTKVDKRLFGKESLKFLSGDTIQAIHDLDFYIPSNITKRNAFIELFSLLKLINFVPKIGKHLLDESEFYNSNLKYRNYAEYKYRISKHVLSTSLTTYPVE